MNLLTIPKKVWKWERFQTVIVNPHSIKTNRAAKLAQKIRSCDGETADLISENRITLYHKQ